MRFQQTIAEVDFLVVKGRTLVPIEAKLSSTPRPEMAAGISALRESLGKRVSAGYVVHPGGIRLPLGPDATALPFSEL